MQPYYSHNGITIYHGDCFEIIPMLPAVDLVFADPPYNIGKADWDRVEAYEGWCREWIMLCSDALTDNGAFWVSHSKPPVLADLSRVIAGCGRDLINWVTWDKYGGAGTLQGFMDGFTLSGSVRSFQPMAEYLVWHADEGQWTNQCDKTRGFIFEPLRAYLAGERDRAGWTTRRVAVEYQKIRGSRTVTGMAGHWFERVQWTLPTEQNYTWLRTLFNPTGNEFLRREYEHLRREYEHLRYTFNNPGKVSSVWQFPPAGKNGHPTPKPEPLLERIVLATSNPGDVVLDPFAGSGTTLWAAQKHGRAAIGIEIEERYCEIAVRRLEQEVLPL